MKTVFLTLLCGLLLSGCALTTEDAKPSTPSSSSTKKHPTAKPAVTVTPEPIRAATPKPTAYPVAKRFSEDERRDIFRSIVEAEDRGAEEAEKTFPTDLNNPSVSVDQASSNVEANTKLTNELQEKYHNEVYKQFHLSKKEQDLIGDEGIEKHWPPL